MATKHTTLPPKLHKSRQNLRIETMDNRDVDPSSTASESKDTSLPPKSRKFWPDSRIVETTSSGDDPTGTGTDPTAVTEHTWCPEIVDIMAKFGQTPADMIVSDDEDSDTGEKDSDASAPKVPLPSLKIRIRGYQAGASKKSSSSELSTPCAKPDSAIHLEDDTEPEVTGSQPEEESDRDDTEVTGSQPEDESDRDDTQKQPDDTQKQPNMNLKRHRDHDSDHESSEHVESNAKKSKMEKAEPKRPRGRPRKTSKDKKEEKRHEKEFSVVVYVEVAVPPKLHAGKTHKGDKMVPQAPRMCGPFSMFRRTKWSSFLENVVAVTRIDEENLLLPGMTWRMQGKRELDALPLQSRDAFKAMRNILKDKARKLKEKPVLLVHHPIVTGGEKQTNHNNGGSTAQEITTGRWSEKLSLDDQLKPIVEQLTERYPIGNCADHQDVRCFHTYTAIENGMKWHILLDDRRLKVWAVAILRKEASIERAPIGKHLFQPKDRMRVEPTRPSSTPSTPSQFNYPTIPTTAYSAHAQAPGYAVGWPQTPSPMAPGPYSPFYHPPFYSPMVPGHAAAQMSPWGFGDHLTNGASAQLPLASTSKLSSNKIEEWCNKHNLGDEECRGLVKLGFRLDKPEELDDLDEATWASVGLGLLHQRRIKAACAATKKT